MVYLWRAVHSQSEILDVLVRFKQNRHAKKYAFVPERLAHIRLKSR
jgi:transposase-like protein